ncbi:MAG: hypothetical protein QM809_18400 [Gordonia sp. (in: high G+C Gram-positive bacteria)]|uniref:WD40 repeat domain-containing protein n=1 Tax=Gordonia sp. (in: high G+C Gram-positive bacteria) TaxID=84139 RepID=UPI0039E47C7E
MNDQTSVLVLGSPNDDRALAEIGAVLHDRGVTVLRSPADGRPADDGYDAIMIAVSDRLLEDPEMMAALSARRTAKLIPIRVGPVDDTRVPEFLGELNWILWDTPATEVGARNAQLMTALRMDLNRYRDAQSLRAQAAAWRASGGDPGFLISDRAAVVRALERADRSDAAEVARPEDDQVRAFLEASHRSVRKEARRRSRRWLFRLAVLGAVALIAVTGWKAVTERRSANLLAGGLLSVSDNDERADLQALKTAGLVQQQIEADRPVPSAAYGKLITTMAHPWGLGVIGFGKDAHLNGAAFTADPSVLVTADSIGTLARWDLRNGGMTTRRQIGGSPLYDLSATPDGRTVLTYDDRKVLRITDVESGRSSETTLSDYPDHIALSADGTAAAAAVGEELFAVTADSAGRWTARRTGRFDAIHQLRAGPSGILAAVRDGRRIAVVDVATGRIRQRFPATADPDGLDRSGVSPTGETVVFVDGSGAVFVGTGGDLRPLGVTTTRGTERVTVDDDGLVVFASTHSGARVLDVASGTIAQVCDSFDSVDRVVVDAHRSRLVCRSRGNLMIDELTRHLSRAQTPSAAVGTSGASAEASGTRIALDDDALVTIARKGTTSRLDFRRPAAAGGATARWAPGPVFGEGTPVVAAVTPDGNTVAVGTDAGVVTEIDVSDDGALALAGRADVGPRAATDLRWDVRTHRIWIRTDDDRSWSLPSCAGCGGSLERLFEVIRERRWFCYPNETLAVFTGATRSTFALTECPKPKAADR